MKRSESMIEAATFKVALVGPVGNGKSRLAASVFRTIKAEPSRYAFSRNSDSLGRQIEASEKHLPTQRTREYALSGEAPPDAETLEFCFDNGARRVELRARGGEALLTPHSGGVDIASLIAEHSEYHLLVAVINPFDHDAHLLTWSWLKAAALLQERAPLTLGKAVDWAAAMLMGLTAEGLVKTNCGYDRVPAAVLESGRISVYAGARFERPAREDDDPDLEMLMQAFPIAGVSEAEARNVLRQICRMSRTITAHAPARAATQEIVRRRPDSLIAITHGDLARFLGPVVGREDMLDVGRRMFRGVSVAGIDQVVLTENVDIVVQSDAQVPLYYRGARAGAADLIEVMTRKLRTVSPAAAARHAGDGPKARNWKWRSTALKVAMATLLVAAAGALVWAGVSGRLSGPSPTMLTGLTACAATTVGLTWLVTRRRVVR